MSNQDISIEIVDLEKVIQATKALQDTGKSKALKRGLGKGGRYLMQKSKARLKKGMKNPNGVTGNLLKSYQVKVKKENTGILMGFKRSTTGEFGGGNHAHLVDMGHEVVVGKHRVRTGKRTKALLFQTDTRNDMPQAAKIASQGIVEMINEYR